MINVLVVDDEESIRDVLSQLIELSGHRCTQAVDGKDARAKIREKPFELVLCDVNMPGESGIDLVRDILRQYPETAVVMVTGMDDPEFAATALDVGAYGYIIKPFKANELMISVANALRRRKLEIEYRDHQRNLEQTVASRTSDLQETLEKLNKTLSGIIQAMTAVVEFRDPYTAGHQRRVAELARAIAVVMNLPGDRVDGIRMAGVVHDLGKISTPAEILSKPGKLNDVEFSLIKFHPQIGFNILKEIDFPWPVAQMVLQHHEKLDGSGYPNGISGDGILLDSRILTVADVVEAMASHRPYRPGLGIEAALAEISEYSGTLYDPEAVKACTRLFRENRFRFD
jgi:response regulator RpfG family c-di-GMP phosphodiesterase